VPKTEQNKIVPIIHQFISYHCGGEEVSDTQIMSGTLGNNIIGSSDRGGR